MAQFDSIDEDVAAILGLEADSLSPRDIVDLSVGRPKSRVLAPLLAGLLVITAALVFGDQRAAQNSQPGPAVANATAVRAGDHPPLAQSFIVERPVAPNSLIQSRLLAGTSDAHLLRRTSHRRTQEANGDRRLAALTDARREARIILSPKRLAITLADDPTRGDAASDMAREKSVPTVELERAERLEALDAIRQLRQK